jgi:hypothetical protein
VPLRNSYGSQVLSTVLHQEWTDHVKSLGALLKYALPFPQTLGYRTKIASHGILSGAATTNSNRFPHFNFLSEEEKKIQNIDALTGLSPELLSIIHETNELAFQEKPYSFMAGHLLKRLENLT